MTKREISSLHELIAEVLSDYSSWDPDTRPWFRGEPEKSRNPNVPLQPLLPKLFRGNHDERKLLQEFRMRAPSLGMPYVPHRDFTDQWLFLAQHVGLPTRLLDWTEGLLIALHFALYSKRKGCVIWMLNPDELNKKTDPRYKIDQVQLTWFDRREVMLQRYDLNLLSLPDGDRRDYFEQIRGEIQPNLTKMNFHYAWTHDKDPDTKEPILSKLPFAIPTTNIHPRMSSQRSRFTIHGIIEKSMVDMNFGPSILRRYKIDKDAIISMKDDLRTLGITHSSLFPELDGLSAELSSYY